MSLRLDILKCINESASSDDAAKLICGYLYAVNLAEPGNGWFDDDPEMEEALDEFYEQWMKIRLSNTVEE